MLDPISDMLTRIRNAQMANHRTVAMPSSKFKAAIAEVLKSEGFIKDFSVTDDGVKRTLSLVLRYTDTDNNSVAGTSQKAAITKINRISTEGQRSYVRANDIHKVKNGYGISIISTSQGVMTGTQARKKRLGGEIICEVW